MRRTRAGSAELRRSGALPHPSEQLAAVLRRFRRWERTDSAELRRSVRQPGARNPCGGFTPISAVGAYGFGGATPICTATACEREHTNGGMRTNGE